MKFEGFQLSLNACLLSTARVVAVFVALLCGEDVTRHVNDFLSVSNQVEQQQKKIIYLKIQHKKILNKNLRRNISCSELINVSNNNISNDDIINNYICIINDNHINNHISKINNINNNKDTVEGR
ncbi:hypothetical protein HELRODRAFT_166061 [Helobdella robusta]|uniref:Uncharacterized protein n=1 Tax=Helobdella robusta TaxID=6412 RepID=T1EXN8_HELRO|nr:hypothetical protein HELRODRAFT_166061 [Helobdella robusta]ESN90396.1 hypothetical protein HELRODRAFT_166061 [Helobdella robusta]